MSGTKILGKPSLKRSFDEETLDRLFLQVCLDGALGYEPLIHSSVRVLRSEGANLSLEGLLSVTKGDDSNLLELLLDLFPDTPHKWLSEALYQAISTGRVQSIRILLKKGAVLEGPLPEALGLCEPLEKRIEVSRALGLEVLHSRL